MRRTTRFGGFFAALAVSACATTPIAVGDYCFTARRVALYHMCPPGMVPVLTEEGWGSCSLVTKGDGTRLAAEAEKYDERCPPATPREED